MDDFGRGRAGSVFDKNVSLTVVLSCVVLLLVFLIVFVIKPGVVGYTIYQEIEGSNYSVEDYGKSLEEIRLELAASQTAESSCDIFSERVLESLSNSSDKLSACSSALSALEVSFNLSAIRYEEIIQGMEEDYTSSVLQLDASYDEKMQDVDDQYEDKQDEISTLMKDYAGLAENTANNLCCKAKIDDPDIAFYAVQNNKVVCLEEGILALSC